MLLLSARDALWRAALVPSVLGGRDGCDTLRTQFQQVLKEYYGLLLTRALLPSICKARKSVVRVMSPCKLMSTRRHALCTDYYRRSITSGFAAHTCAKSWVVGDKAIFIGATAGHDMTKLPLVIFLLKYRTNRLHPITVCGSQCRYP